ncbi:Tfp pilus assembly protein FimT/FimU [Aquimarina sp. W85]|uniref:pilus assembly FimT family protein n=1 Tax=Aquimarina rhodophyticola TaxID=3342246 RepID=UPI00367311BD
MVILKKIKGATLIETLTASVILILVFMIASLSFNTVFGNHIERNTGRIENRINELHYQYIHRKIKLPYFETYGKFEIEISIKDRKTIAVYRKDSKEKTRIFCGYHEIK